jgi:hypothetical protein
MTKQLNYLPFISQLFIIVSILFLIGESNGAIQFQNIATDPASGLSDYVRAESPLLIEQLNKFKNFSGQETPLSEFQFFPVHPNGQPGIVAFDFDNDGDVDIYAPNGPGSPNALFKNQFIETGNLTFVDVTSESGVSLTEQDCTGACFGDLDNRGLNDLIVLVRDDTNHIFKNNGDGTFTDISGSSSGFGLTNFNGTSNCILGDVNEDGRLDIHVGNTFEWRENIPVFGTIFDNPFFLNSPDELYLNLGGFQFEDVSNSSGAIRQDLNNITWAQVFYDFDGDGHLDLIKAQDVNIIAVLKGDGHGFFVDVTADVGLSGIENAGGWMGISVADFNYDGLLDFWVTNFGTYTTALNITGRVSRTVADAIANGVPPGDALDIRSTTGFNFQSNGTFVRYPIIGTLEATPFGWGNSASDYDNDGCIDHAFFGAIDWGAGLALNNPGTFLMNPNCDGEFVYDSSVRDPATNHSLMVEHGVATADFNNDGFPDLVIAVAANYDNDSMPTDFVPQTILPYGGPLDDEAVNANPFEFVFPSAGPPFARFKGKEFLPSQGKLLLDINNADNDNKFITVQVKGMIGLTPDGKVNRNGFGVQIKSTPVNGDKSGKISYIPVLGGSSHASQDSEVKTFGLANGHLTDVEVIWPGNVRNKLFNVWEGKRLIFPEIPCSFDDQDLNIFQYTRCVTKALKDAKNAGFINIIDFAKFLYSAIKARSEN